METAAPSHSEGDHDVPYFRSLLKSETARLNALSDKWNTINDTTEEISEEGRREWTHDGLYSSYMLTPLANLTLGNETNPGSGPSQISWL